MAVNYTLTPTIQANIVPGQTFGSNFSSGPYVLEASIQAYSGYTVSYEMFSISGGGPEPIENGNRFVQSDADTNLPSYIYYVDFTNDQTNSSVKVTAVIDPNWVVSSNLTGLFTTILDIDGDAQPVAVVTASQFQIHCELTGDTPGAKVFAITPLDQNAPYSSYDFTTAPPWQITTVSPYAPYTKASVNCTYAPYAGVNESSDQMSQDVFGKYAFFFIIPDEGYYVSRNSFYPENGTVTSPSNTIDATGAPVALTSTDSSSVHQFAGLVNLAAQYETTTNIPGSSLFTSPYPYTGYGSFTPGEGDVYLDYGGEQVTATTLFNNSEYGYQSEMYGKFGQITFMDAKNIGIDGEPMYSWLNVPYPYSLMPVDFLNGTPIDPYCANTWTHNNPPPLNKNVVIVAFRGIQSHVPGLNPSDITLKLSGQAMADNGDCEEFNIEIEE